MAAKKRKMYWLDFSFPAEGGGIISVNYDGNNFFLISLLKNSYLNNMAAWSINEKTYLTSDMYYKFMKKYKGDLAKAHKLLYNQFVPSEGDCSPS